MARSKKRSAGRGRTQPAAKPARQRKPRAEVEVVDEESGPGWETGVAVLTGIIILVAILITDYNLGLSGEGIFFG